MADHTKIEWADATWQAITGCSVVSPGCTNCYAMKLAGTRLRHHPSRAGLTKDSKAGPVWTGEVRLNGGWLTQPLHWKRPRRIFVCAHGDLFHPAVPDEWIDKVFAVMALCPQHEFQVLTKRSGRMREYLSRNDVSLFDRWSKAFDPGTFCMSQHEIEAHLSPFATAEHRALYRATYPVYPLENVLLGGSVEDQDRADERRDHLGPLARKHGWRTFVSYEPALGPVDWIGWEFLSWMISGGESGQDARPSHPDWHRAARDFCAGAGVPYFFKQWGDWAAVIDRDNDDPDWRKDYSRKYDDSGDMKWINLAGGRGFHGERFHVMQRVGKKASGRLLDGVEHNAMPEAHHG